MANFKTVRSPENDPQTGKPQEWRFDMSDPADSAAYAQTMKAWYPDSLKTKNAREAERIMGSPPQGSPELRSQIVRQIGSGLTSAIPPGAAGVGAVIGTVGGAAAGGPWGARLGGALGSAAGGALGAQQVGQSPGEAALGYGLADVGGQAISGGLKAGGEGLMRSAVNPPEWISRYFPGAWRTALREKAGLGAARDAVEGPEKAGLIEKMLGNRTGATGANAVESVLLPRAESVVQQRLASVPSQTVNLAKDVVPEVRRRLLNGSVGRMPIGRAEMTKQVDAVLAQMVKENPGAFDMARFHDLKRGSQEIASNLYEQLANARKSGAVVDQKAAVEEKVMKEAATVMRTILGKKVPGYNAAEARSEALLGLKKALRYREAMPPEGLGTRVGHAVYFDPMGLIPEHARSTMARGMYGPGAAAGRMAPTALFPFLHPAQPDTTGVQ